MVGAVDRLAYGVSQAARVGWYTAHYALARRLAVQGRPSERSGGALRERLRRDLLGLFRRDWSNIEAGHYALPEALPGNPLAGIRRSFQFFADLPEVNRRRLEKRVDEPFRMADGRAHPRYYLQNFHFQTDGYLSRHSAELYDTQVEVLFTGAADAMRRQALVPIGAAVRAAGPRRARLLDLGCGTGRFLAAVKENWPRLAVAGIDLSAPYLEAAGRRLSPWSRTALVQAAAEAAPFAGGAFDVVTCVYLLHELPREVRRKLAAEAARLLAPGGRLVVVDSLQMGDVTAYDALLEAFPSAFHEPYYADYARTDLAGLFGAAGLACEGSSLAFLSKVMVFAKP